jgi:YfiH family protein
LAQPPAFGCSTGVYGRLNLGNHVGDLPALVEANRRLLQQYCDLPREPVWLNQVHGTTVLDLDLWQGQLTAADASISTTVGLAAVVMTADCLPVLFCDQTGTRVAAAHAGWRGLAAGVLEATIAALRHGAGVEADELQVWLGPCIGPQAFEVGADVLEGFGESPRHADAALFRPRLRPDGSARWLADLPALAVRRLQAAGVPERAIHRSGRCTVHEASDFFSFRRDGTTGRQAAAIWRRA